MKSDLLFSKMSAEDVSQVCDVNHTMWSWLWGKISNQDRKFSIMMSTSSGSRIAFTFNFRLVLNFREIRMYGAAEGWKPERFCKSRYEPSFRKNDSSYRLFVAASSRLQSERVFRQFIRCVLTMYFSLLQVQNSLDMLPKLSAHLPLEHFQAKDSSAPSPVSAARCSPRRRWASLSPLSASSIM